MRLGRALLQIGVLSAFFVGSTALSRALHLPIPGNVVGALLLALLLAVGVVPLRWVEDGADLLLKNLGLLFVPAAVLVVRIVPSVRHQLWAIALVMVVSTLIVLVVTGLLSERWKNR